MDILLIHHILEYHDCRIDPDISLLTRKITSCLKKNKFSLEQSLNSWQTGQTIFISEINDKYMLLLQYHCDKKILFCDLQLKVENKTISRLFTDIKKAVDSRNFTSLEIKRGIWDKRPSHPASQ